VGKTILKRIGPNTDVTPLLIEKAIAEVKSSKVGKALDPGTPLMQAPSTQELKQCRDDLVSNLPAIVKHRNAPAVIDLLSSNPQTVEMDQLYAMMRMSLKRIDVAWAKIKPTGQDAMMDVIVNVKDLAGAKGAAGELRAAEFALPRSETINFAKDKEKYPGGQPATDERREQDIDISATRKGTSGQDERVYTEAKYDMDTFLDKAKKKKQQVMTSAGNVPKQLFMYGVVRDRVKLKPAKTPTKRLELYIANPHDWLLLFLPANARICKLLLANKWTIVIGNEVVSEDRANKLLAWVDTVARQQGTGKDADQKDWALKTSQNFTPLTLPLSRRPVACSALVSISAARSRILCCSSPMGSCMACSSPIPERSTFAISSASVGRSASICLRRSTSWRRTSTSGTMGCHARSRKRGLGQSSVPRSTRSGRWRAAAVGTT
jgi:hypothetical protein